MSKKTSNTKKAGPSRAAPVSILVMDEASGEWEPLAGTLRRKGFDVRFCQDAEHGLAQLARHPFDVLIASQERPKAGRIHLLRQVKSLSPETEVIVTITPETLHRAFQAIKAGAYDYLVQPIQREELSIAVERALERRQLTQKIRMLEEHAHQRRPFESIIWTSSSMNELMRTVQQVARLDAPVLISGETGTGKELLARTLHNLSSRKNGPLVIINCDAIPEDLQEPELFGRASNGADPAKRGLIEEAHGGSVLLDEINELTPKAQTAVLRFLQNGEVSTAGSDVGRCADVRVIAATKRDLERCVERNSFREELYYRLNVIPIHIPPLRERPEDIPLLAQRFTRLAAERGGIAPPPSISPRVLSAFFEQPWRGNVRELECTIERAVAFDRDGVIGMDDLNSGESQRIEDKVLDRASQKRLNLSELEREYILEVLAECGGSRKRTAERLGITTATLWRKLKQYEQQSNGLAPRSSNPEKSG